MKKIRVLVIDDSAAIRGLIRGAVAAPALHDGAPPPNRPAASQKIIVVGASTGGTEAIREMLTRMPPGSPGILIAQHMPEGFTRSFAARLDTLCRIRVKEAEHGGQVLAGHAYIAPGHSHLMLGRSGTRYTTRLSQSGSVNRHRPSVDVLFRSAAAVGGPNVIGVILTGMGKDGAAGLLELKRAGAYTFAQDEDSCVVFGMPKEAIALGGVDEVQPVERIAGALLARLAQGAQLRETGERLKDAGAQPLNTAHLRSERPHEP